MSADPLARPCHHCGVAPRVPCIATTTGRPYDGTHSVRFTDWPTCRCSWMDCRSERTRMEGRSERTEPSVMEQVGWWCGWCEPGEGHFSSEPCKGGAVPLYAPRPVAGFVSTWIAKETK